MRINAIAKQPNIKGQRINHNSKKVMSKSVAKTEKNIGMFSTSPVSKTDFSNINFKGGQELIQAAADGHLTRFNMELAKGVDVNYKGNLYIDGKEYRKINALLAVCIANNISSLSKLSFIKKLLEYPELEVNECDYYSQQTPLMWLCENNDESCVEELLKHPDIQIYKYNLERETALDKSRSHKIDLLIKSYRKGVDRRDNFIMDKSYQALSTSNELISLLAPETNNMTKEEISRYFIKLVQQSDFDAAKKLLAATPLIDLESNNKQILNMVCSTGNSDFVEHVFKYKAEQPKMLEEYDAKRKIFFEQTLPTLSYEELKENPIINTPDGFKELIKREEFNPNDKIPACSNPFKSDNSTLFYLACKIDPEGNLAQEILSEYDNVDTSFSKDNLSGEILSAITEYENFGKLKIKLSNPETREATLKSFEEFIDSNLYNPDNTDYLGNYYIHIISQIPSQKRILKKLINSKSSTEYEKITNAASYINYKNITGETPIMSVMKILAITDDPNDRAGLMENILFMVDNGADLNASDNNHNSVWHYVCKTSSQALLSLVISKGITPFLKDATGKLGFEYLPTQELKNFCLDCFSGKIKV